jgi:hypothetical protein
MVRQDVGSRIETKATDAKMTWYTQRQAKEKVEELIFETV